MDYGEQKIHLHLISASVFSNTYSSNITSKRDNDGRYGHEQAGRGGPKHFYHIHCFLDYHYQCNCDREHQQSECHISSPLPKARTQQLDATHDKGPDSEKRHPTGSDACGPSQVSEISKSQIRAKPAASARVDNSPRRPYHHIVFQNQTP